MAKHVLSAESRALILAGGTELEIPEATPVQGPAATPAQPQGTPAAAAPVVVDPAAATASSIEVLATQLGASQARVGELTAELASVKAQGSELAAQLPGLLEIARAAVANMQIGLGTSASTAAMDAKALLAEHARVAPEFAKRFPAGGVSSSAASTDEPSGTPASPELLRRLSMIK